MCAEERTAALVVLKPGAGEAERAKKYFADAGFELGPLVGISFSISGAAALMDQTFADFRALHGSGGELDLSKLPDDVRGVVRAVVTEAPPDFGPTAP